MMMIRKHLLAAAIVSYSSKAITKPITTTATKSAATTTTTKTNLAATTSSSTSTFHQPSQAGGYGYNTKNLQFRGGGGGGGGGKIAHPTTSSVVSMSTSSDNNEGNSRNDYVVDDDINKNGNTPPSLPSLPSLVLIGDKELMTPCEPCNQKDIDELKSSNDSSGDNNNNNILKKQLQELKACQKYYGGIGIAACQVGWRARIFCMGIESCDVAARSRYPDASEFTFQYWINPIIKPDPTGGKSWFWEGCLSVPGMRGWVERPNVVTLCGYNEFGEYREVELDGLPARVAQHEYDHLDGILFPNRALPNTLLPVQAFEKQDNWPLDWPTSGSRQTKPGGFSYDK